MPYGDLSVGLNFGNLAAPGTRGSRGRTAIPIPSHSDLGRTVKSWVVTGTAAIAALVSATSASLAPANAVGPPARPDTDRLVARIAIFGTDERVPVPQRHAALAERIGVLFNNRARTVCTAFCVAPGMVATAAHCVSQQAPGKSPMRASDFLFARAYDKLRDYARIEGFATSSGPQHIMSGDFHLNVRPPIDAVKDWALVRLARPLCGSGLPVRVLPTPQIIEQAKAGKVFQISYHRDLPTWQPSYVGPCHVGRDFGTSEWTAIAPDFEQPEQIVLHTCDTGGASSGSPLFVEGEGGPAVVAMNVGTYVQSRVANGKAAEDAKATSETIANTAINARTFADQIAVLRVAAILTTGVRIRQLQEHLAAMQLYAGRADGDYGPLLRAAIASYEAQRSMPVTGLATVPLLARLDREARAAGGRTVIPSVGASRERRIAPPLLRSLTPPN